MSEHISKQFDAELEMARAKILAMAGLVEEQFGDAMAALEGGDLELINKVIETENRVNVMHVEIDDNVMHIIARRQPAASDLRMVLTVNKVVNDLERIGDKACKISRRAKQIYGEGRVNVPRMSDLTYQSNIALSMLRTALDGFARLDPSVAGTVAREDIKLDEEFKAIQRQLITYMMEDPRTISLALEIIEIAKAIERVGDHAKNIAEYVVYLVKGIDVRHSPVEEIEKQAR
ncbi:phosphate signaling complex protein PhoU [Chitinimonas sp. BJB300]|uniref:phosphate signaling complex protein PhoU n=1 Tax=Chitinimonas sp. BJB300 TaxID=1559339 RepID=UPI000C0FF3B4|nr:phosphate signaling complex protein PhoU [Chitinimonas sp. BJB300]PHV11979.1 phosphate transport system regulatory protein PhoU [Chitinimonas sp. BJB300]TSJ91422.1 phosphate signaling complex protein PhoU [Chitinimonas sp. BJB300]